MVTSMLNLVIALDCEAKPIIEHFHLKRQAEHTLPVYTTDNMQLIVAGVGKLNAAMATAYLAGMRNDNAAWLNIGIAGHKSHAIGTAYVAHKVMDHTTQQNWYPALTFKPAIATETVCSFESPVMDYHDDLLHDMEAAGFYQAASRFNSAEFVHCLKIVSDNAEQSTHKINKQMVSELVTAQIDAIADFISKLNDQLNEWHNISRTPAAYVELLQRWHFSTYQQHQLKQLVQRWTTLYPDAELLTAELTSLKSSREVLKYLQDSLDIVASA